MNAYLGFLADILDKLIVHYVVFKVSGFLGDSASKKADGTVVDLYGHVRKKKGHTHIPPIPISGPSLSLNSSSLSMK